MANGKVIWIIYAWANGVDLDQTLLLIPCSVNLYCQKEAKAFLKSYLPLKIYYHKDIMKVSFFKRKKQTNNKKKLSCAFVYIA